MSAIDDRGAILVTGKFLGAIDFGGAVVQDDREDAFVAKIRP
jgi:hypothetical protein